MHHFTKHTLQLLSSFGLAVLLSACEKDSGAGTTAASSEDEAGDEAANGADGEEEAGDEASEEAGDEAETADEEQDDSGNDDQGDEESNSGGESDCIPGKNQCGDNEKCTPFKMESDCCVDAAHCVDITGSDKRGETCTSDALNGTDTCDKGLFCRIGGSAGGGEGVCIQLCDADNPKSCDELGLPGQDCFNFNDGFLPVCKDTCNPLNQDCEAEEANCYQEEDGYLCGEPDVPDGGGRVGSPCSTNKHCQRGLNCQAPDTLRDCTADDGCCSAFCDTEKDSAEQCTVEGEVCVALFPDKPPPGRENVGICGRSDLVR